MTFRACTNRSVVDNFALSVFSTHTSSARINAFVVDTCMIKGAITVTHTLRLTIGRGTNVAIGTITLSIVLICNGAFAMLATWAWVARVG